MCAAAAIAMHQRTTDPPGRGELTGVVAGRGPAAIAWLPAGGGPSDAWTPFESKGPTFRSLYYTRRALSLSPLRVLGISPLPCPVVGTAAATG